MGGDDAPRSNVAGAIDAARHGFQILLVGEEAVLREEIAERGGLPQGVHLHHASEVVEMDEGASSAARRKRDSSLRVAFELVHRGQADAIVTMGHSGAAMASGLFVCGRIDAVLRPAIATIFRGRKGPVALLDAGANVDCRPEHLLQFGTMGAALFKAAFGASTPRVALLSNGTEPEKGTETTRAAAQLLASAAGIEFGGYIEPGSVLGGEVQVVVTDGWTGNIMVKAAEGMALHIKELLREAAGRNALSQAGALLMKPSLRQAMANLDYSEYGGGLLLGIDAVTVIGHGAADAAAVSNALLFADRVARAALLDQIKESVSESIEATAAVEMPHGGE
jgi:glycerol-3-phosphate acyltransferase PlsX